MLLCITIVSQVVSWIVSWCLEPGQPQRITSSLNTNFTLLISQVIIPQIMWVFVVVVLFCLFFSLFIFRGHSTREPASGRVTYFISRAYTGTSVSHSQHRRNRERFWKKNAGGWTGRIEISKEEVPCSKLSMYGYILTYSRL